MYRAYNMYELSGIENEKEEENLSFFRKVWNELTDVAVVAGMVFAFVYLA